MLHAVDDLDWKTVRSLLADEVRTDYTSLFGGEATTTSGDELVAQWQGLMPGFAATQHLTGPVVETDGVAETHLQAHHWMADGRRWVVYAHYIAVIEDGRVADLTLRLHRQEGDTDLPAAAAANPNKRG
jgi:hypothetical protein